MGQCGVPVHDKKTIFVNALDVIQVLTGIKMISVWEGPKKNVFCLFEAKPKGLCVAGKRKKFGD